MAAPLLLVASAVLVAAPAPDSAEGSGPPPVAAEDRRRLTALAEDLPGHGLPPVEVPAADTPHAAWETLAARLARRFAPPSTRGDDSVEALVNARPLAPAVERLVPRHRRYRALVDAMGRLRAALADDPPRLPATPYRIRAGSTADEVRTLRRRLALEGYEAGDPAGRHARYWDPGLKRALWRWQQAHDLPVTTWLDDLTRVRLNEGLEVLPARVAVALQRWRDLEMRSDQGRRVLVHLNRQHLLAESDDAPALEMDVVVGRADEDNATPSVSTVVERVVVHPTWAVPRRIVEEELRPAVNDLPGLLRDRGYRVEVLPDGRWRVLRLAGRHNPLGRLKLPLPGTGGVYLHDTPHRAAFAAETRLRSHGCVRLGDALALARWLLPERAEHLRGLLEAGETRSIPLEAPVPIHLVYQTLTVDEDGRLVAHPDVYGRDREAMEGVDVAALLAASGAGGGADDMDELQ
ncbi:MAG: L,D-transpeptidase family protein [Myxococcota bacterium]